MWEQSIGKKIVYGLVLIIFFSAMYFTFSSDTALPKIFGMVMIPIGIMFFLINPEFDFAKELSVLPVMMLLQLAVILLLSFFIWIIDIQKANYMLPGFIRVLYQLINVLVVFFAVYVLREKTVEAAFLSATAFNLYKFILAIQVHGYSTLISDIIETFKTGDQTGILTGLELNSLTYSIGLFGIYFTIFGGNISNKKRITYAVIANVLFLLGFKRIGLLAIILSYAICIVFKMLSEERANRFCIIIGIGIVVCSIVYIPIVKYNIFTKILSLYNIKANARDSLYNIVSNQYSFSPAFLGKGYSFVTEYLTYMRSLHLKYVGAGAHFVHNDILVYYIELGFWGFIGWLVYNCVVYQKFFQKHYGTRIATLYCAMNLYNYISYLTDNMATNYAVNMAFRLILLSVVCEDIKKRNLKIPNVKRMTKHWRKSTTKK